MQDHATHGFEPGLGLGLGLAYFLSDAQQKIFNDNLLKSYSHDICFLGQHQ
jgi:hypothetical protein